MTRLERLNREAVGIKRKINRVITITFNVIIFMSLVKYLKVWAPQADLFGCIIVSSLLVSFLYAVEYTASLLSPSYSIGYRHIQIRLFKEDWIRLNRGDILIEEGIEFNKLYREVLEYNGMNAPFRNKFGINELISNSSNLSHIKKVVPAT